VRGLVADLLAIGAYPSRQHPDLCRADLGAHHRAVASIAAVPLPSVDPVTGGAGPLLEHWRQRPD
jgi:uncharacterized protein YjlB